jgi:hypothetical protein
MAMSLALARRNNNAQMICRELKKNNKFTFIFFKKDIFTKLIHKLK